MTTIIDKQTDAQRIANEAGMQLSSIELAQFQKSLKQGASVGKALDAVLLERLRANRKKSRHPRRHDNEAVCMHAWEARRNMAGQRRLRAQAERDMPLRLSRWMETSPWFREEAVRGGRYNGIGKAVAKGVAEGAASAGAWAVLDAFAED